MHTITASGATAGNRIDPFTEAELELLDRASAVDGSPAISGGLLEIATGADELHEAQTRSSVFRVSSTQTGELLGLGVRALQGDRQAAEFLVAPDARGQGIGEALLSTILAEEPESWSWSHGDHPAAAALAKRHHLARERVLYQMRTDEGLVIDQLPETNAPADVTIRSFAPGDEPGWLRVNNAAFDWHPEQGSQTLEDLAAIVGDPDFDPESVIIATRDDRIIGFHQTKITEGHAGADAGTGSHLGEVYVVGVDPTAHAKGVGRALTIEGMRRMVTRGVGVIELYVESDNEPALGLYQRLGFQVAVAHVSYAPPTTTEG